ncbi:MAG: flagellar biosynthetic protein FliP [Phycisphaeraceae bacterium]|nr:MAG: flagellar biosynthetic protein FliP [Phycisphaeraceae bacterium]
MTSFARAIVWLLVGAVTFAWAASPSLAQVGPQRPDRAVEAATPLANQFQAPTSLNPMTMLRDAGNALPGGASSDGGDSGGLSVGINIMLLLTVVALVPSIMLMTTCFVRIIIVLSLLRQAMGTQSLPPTQVITGLALFMTALVMQPTMDRVWNEAVVPYQNGEIRDYETLWDAGVQPMRDFMFDQIEATDNWSSLYMILNYKGVDTSEPENLTRADVKTTELVPAYMLSELKVSFLMGFRVYLPFLVIDMVIASLLISMSMMMLPPVLISLPFKLMLFVLVDGWTLVVGSLLESFVVAPPGGAAGSAAMLLLIPWMIKSPDPPGPCAPRTVRRFRWAWRPAHAVRRITRSDRP